MADGYQAYGAARKKLSEKIALAVCRAYTPNEVKDLTERRDNPRSQLSIGTALALGQVAFSVQGHY
jgi:hypothetical protein